MAVLQRDLEAEEQRIKMAQAAVSSRIHSKTPTSSPTLTRAQLPAASSTQPSPVGGASLTLSPAPMEPSEISPPAPPESPSVSIRRPSVISLSSLHRPFPHKLDLSAPTLRIGADEFPQDLPSPVTLAPRSARPTAGVDLPPELLAIVTDSAPPADPHSIIDLTLGDDPVVSVDHGALGTSADKPIELDLDMEMDLFGDAQPIGESGAGDAHDDIFATLGASGALDVAPVQIKTEPDTESHVVESPGSLLAQIATVPVAPDLTSEPSASFDLDNLGHLPGMQNFNSDIFNGHPETFNLESGDGDISMEAMNDLLKMDEGSGSVDAPTSQ
jgi:hypothetical protein